MTPSGKWIEGIGPDSSVAATARAALDARLAAVSYWLPAAAYCADHDVEHVHRLRVSTRRAIAALKLYCDWLPGKSARWLKKRLKTIRQAAGDARDLDVLAERLKKELNGPGNGVLDEITARRAAVQPAIECIADRCRRKRCFNRAITKLLSGIKPGGESREVIGVRTTLFGPWAKQRLISAADEFFAATPADDADTTILHQFRISAKALRYAIELLAPAFGPTLREELYPVIEELQERLGKINDHVAAAARLREWATETTLAADQQPFIDQAQRESDQLDEQLRKYRNWWTPERAESLRRGLLNGSALAAPQDTLAKLEGPNSVAIFASPQNT